MQEQAPYVLIGGEARVRELTDRFYDAMDNLPKVRKIRDLHAASLRISREKLFLFLSGWLGGPNLYVEKYGHPRLRQRHMPFAIGTAERDQWMLCMRRALHDMDLDDELRDGLEQSFWRTADHMRNQSDDNASEDQ